MSLFTEMMEEQSQADCKINELENKIQKLTNFLKGEIVITLTNNRIENICMQEAKRQIEKYRDEILKILESEENKDEK